jgi:hypothetical protein
MLRLSPTVLDRLSHVKRLKRGRAESELNVVSVFRCGPAYRYCNENSDNDMGVS